MGGHGTSVSRPSNDPNRKMEKIYTYVAGNTLDSHEKFLQQLTKKGAKLVKSLEESNVTIVFCPIVSRFEPDINSAISRASELGCQEVILVAMHYTFDKDLVLPNRRALDNRAVILLVDCLFSEEKGLFKCPCNKNAVKAVCKQLGLKTRCLLLD